MLGSDSSTSACSLFALDDNLSSHSCAAWALASVWEESRLPGADDSDAGHMMLKAGCQFGYLAAIAATSGGNALLGAP